MTQVEPENMEYIVFPRLEKEYHLPHPEVKITAMCAFSNMLFLGTLDGNITQYIFEERDIDQTTFSYTELLTRKISDSSITIMDVCSSANLLTTLSGDTLTFYDAEQMEALDLLPPFRDVSTYQLSPQIGDLTTKLCIAFRNHLVQLYLTCEDKLELMFELTLSFVPLSICVGLNFINLASHDSYMSIDMTKRTATELFKYGKDVGRPLSVHICQDEFLLVGPGSLGLVVDANGNPKRSPMQLSPGILKILVWDNYVFTLTDEFFTIHSISNQNQLQTVLLSNATAACVVADNPHLFFVATAPGSFPADRANLVAIGPERWDRLARKLIVADCIQQAKQLLSKQTARVQLLSEHSSESSRVEQEVFSTRSRRVFGLMGFYYFEKGDLSRAEFYFEKSSMDIREILVRYADLLPNGYNFSPNPFYFLHNHGSRSVAVSAAEDAPPLLCVSELSLSHSIGSQATDDRDLPNPVVTTEWLKKYEEFLFGFLQKHHNSKFAERYSHFLETALVKLYVKLHRHGIPPILSELILPRNSMGQTLTEQMEEQSCNDLVDLISSLAHIDVQDLISFLKQTNAFHILALIYRWQGDIASALDVWQKLVYGDLEDTLFPGTSFYVDIIRRLSSPTFQYPMLGDAISSPEFIYPNEPTQCSAYTTIIWQHVCQALDSGHIDLAKQLLFAIHPSVPSNLTSGSLSIETAKSGCSADAIVSLAPSQSLDSNNLIRKLMDTHVDLAREYLHHLIFVQHDKDPGHHDLLAQLYLNAVSDMLKNEASTDSNNQSLVQLRREFCSLLRYSPQYSPSGILEKWDESLIPKMLYERAIVLGRLGNHRDAINILLNEKSDLPGCLSYCMSYLYEYQKRRRESVKCSPLTQANKGISAQMEVPHQKSAADGGSPDDVFTTLAELCLDRKGKYETFALDLINSSTVPLNYAKILSLLSANYTLTSIVPFVRRALLTTVDELNTSYMQYNLCKRRAMLSAIDRAAHHSDPMVTVNEDTVCSRCNRQLNLYGTGRPFAWLVRTNRMVHVSCLRASDSA